MTQSVAPDTIRGSRADEDYGVEDVPYTLSLFGVSVACGGGDSPGC